MTSSSPGGRSFLRSAAQTWGALLLAGGFGLLAPSAHAQSVATLTCIPAVIGGGTGASASCTVKLTSAAAGGGSAVALGSSLAALAVTPPSITVPAGQTSATFVVATNARYRPYSGLAFNPVITATRTTTASAPLSVTAQQRPADFTSGVAPGARFQWQGNICGGIGPIGGSAEILYKCTPASRTQFGSCTYVQECNIGCRRTPPAGVTFKDVCSTSGPNPVVLSRSVAASGDRVAAQIVTEAPVGTLLTQGMPGAISNQSAIGAINGVSVNASVFPHDGGITVAQGASSANFEVATSLVPSATFIDVVGYWADAGSTVTTNGRSGHAWLALLAPVPPPALPMPTLGDFKITGSNPVVGGLGSIGQIDVSGISSGGGPTLALSSSHPSIASVPASIKMPASATLGEQVTITTQAPATNTPVTITVTDGRTSYSAVLTVLASVPPLLSAVSVTPATVVGGNAAIGTVTLSAAAPAGGTTIALSTPLPNVAVLAASVNVPAGATTATFSIATLPVGEIFSVNIFADLAGTGRQALLMVTPGTGPVPPPTQAALTVNATGRAGPSVASSPAGISVAVPGSQTASFAVGASILLSASNGRDAIWSGACSSAGTKAKTCSFVLLGNASVSAAIQ